MQKFATLSDAIRLAEFAHFNQVDKAGLPYVEHPKRVLEKVKAQGGLPYVQIAAVLHDVTEDTRFTPQMLLDLGFSEAAVEIIKLLDRGYSEWKHFHSDGPLNYAMDGTREQKDYFYYEDIKTSPGAVMVKLADIEDNLSPWRQSYLSQETQDRLREKYAKARMQLQPGVWTNAYHPHGGNQ
jgi:(p)ppGpp synthase/HD superfamily hydrolase